MQSNTLSEQAIFKLRGEWFAQQLFAYLDPGGTGWVADEDIVGVIMALEQGSFEEKVAFLWSLISHHGDYITREELKELLRVRCSHAGYARCNLFCVLLLILFSHFGFDCSHSKQEVGSPQSCIYS